MIRFIQSGVFALLIVAPALRGEEIVLPAPPQDQGLPYTRSGPARGLAAIKEGTAIFATPEFGSRYGYVKGFKVRLDPNEVLAGDAVVRDGVVYVPTSGLDALLALDPEPAPAPDGLDARWVYSFPAAPIAVPANARRIDVNGKPYVAIEDVAKSLGRTVWKSARGVVVISDHKVALDEANAVLMDDIITLFDTPNSLADPDIATRSIPRLKAQGTWVEHVKPSAQDLALLAGTPSEPPLMPPGEFDQTGLDLSLFGSPVPPPGVYPRLLFSPEDVPAIAKRMQSSKLGQRTLAEWDVLLEKSWWNPETSDGQVLRKLASPTEYKTLSWPATDTSPGAGVTHSTFAGQKPGIYSSHINYNTNCLTTMALSCLLRGDEARGRQAAAALANYYRLIEPVVDDLLATSDSEFGTSDSRANFGSTSWRGMHGVVAHMDLAFALDFAGKWMTPADREFMRHFIARATYGRLDNMQAAPTRVRDINHLTWHLTNFLAVSAIEGLPGADPEVLQAGRDSARAFLQWGIDPQGVMFESNGKSGGGMQYQVLTMNVLARRGLNLWGHPHWRRLLAAQAQVTAPNGLATMSSGTWGGGPFAWSSVSMYKAFYPGNIAADYLLTQDVPEFNAATFDPAAYRAALEKSIARVRLPGPNYPGFTFSGIYDTDWRRVSREETGLPLTFESPDYGLLSARSDNSADAAWIALHGRTNQYIGAGHHHADVGMIYYSGLGVNWITESPYPKNYDGIYHNEVLIDGRAEPPGVPARGRYLGAEVKPEAAFASLDLRRSYSYRWCNQLIQWDANPGGAWSVWYPKTGEGYQLETDDPLPLEVYRGTQHNKSRPWWPTYVFSNWLPVLRVAWNPVQYAFRTAGLVRGAQPYALVVDDIKKDDTERHYQWTGILGTDAVPVALPGLRPDELVLARRADVTDGQPRAGVPLLLVRALDPAGKATVRLETGVPPPADDAKARPHDRISVDLQAASANYRILLTSVRAGSVLPKIEYDAASQTASLQIGGQRDQVRFISGGGQRTSFRITRDGNEVVTVP